MQEQRGLIEWNKVVSQISRDPRDEILLLDLFDVIFDQYFRINPPVPLVVMAFAEAVEEQTPP